MVQGCESEIVHVPSNSVRKWQGNKGRAARKRLALRRSWQESLPGVFIGILVSVFLHEGLKLPVPLVVTPLVVKWIVGDTFLSASLALAPNRATATCQRWHIRLPSVNHTTPQTCRSRFWGTRFTNLSTIALQGLLRHRPTCPTMMWSKTMWSKTTWPTLTSQTMT